MTQETELQQLTQSVAALAQSLEHSQQHVRRTKRMLFAIFFLILIAVLGIVLSNSGPFRDAYAADQMAPSQEQILQKMMPALEALGTLVIRIKQDSDIIRAKALMRTMPNKYPPGTPIDMFSPEDLHSIHASNALMVGSISQEIHYLKDSIDRMNFSMGMMNYNMDRTMGRFGDIMP